MENLPNDTARTLSGVGVGKMVGKSVFNPANMSRVFQLGSVSLVLSGVKDGSSSSARAIENSANRSGNGLLARCSISSVPAYVICCVICDRKLASDVAYSSTTQRKKLQPAP